MSESRIVDILSSMERGGVAKKDGRYTLCTYDTKNPTKIESMAGIRPRLKVVRKDVTSITTTIEETWVDVKERPVNEEPNTRCVGMIRTFPRYMVPEIEDEKRYIFISILHRILLDDYIPVGPVKIWMEEYRKDIRICGICHVRKGLKMNNR